ncbi:hypothetical protein [Celeribacter halophilus]|uniref:hypothetical protein n=1 Tax=Celeribacter halophilus TaxID=576117 RepID=UPI002FCFFBC5
MSDPLDIPHMGRKLVWVLSFDGTLDELEALTPEAIAEALGLWAAPDMAHVERFDMATMRDYGFARYLSEAGGFDIGDAAPLLDALTGPVLLIHAKALNDEDTRFSPEPPFQLIARFGTAHDIPPVIGIDSESAKGQLPQGKPPKSPARMSGMVATVVLVFLAFFVAAFVWIGG